MANGKGSACKLFAAVYRRSEVDVLPRDSRFRKRRRCKSNGFARLGSANSQGCHVSGGPPIAVAVRPLSMLQSKPSKTR